MNFDGLYDIRPGKEEDLSFIYATWLKGLYYGDSWFSRMPQKVFMDHYKHVLTQILAVSAVRVACLPDDPDTIIGYSVASRDGTVLHWCHVKAGKKDISWRKHGVARSLIPPNPVYASHINDLGLELLSKLGNTVFNPFSLKG